ncbi:50S ribosomal protein L11 methyltransferase [Prosthecobacter sp.]|uniref:50S ribosomal protein L11 methyltransferase n=1 Tax=Prosthecobacter sp. TaxID=1965333 RepID=UPI001D440A58|nr:50S ribosomal protein L11 methyltransferase [Prosthecobacter sp.]MCB1276291.1 50S ribosomal protein L11 methyltransferase [Prosthecobacter sp.]
MFVWSKLSSARSADDWEECFAGIENATPVITSYPNRKTIRVEVYCGSQKQANAIQKQFGGSVARLKPQNWAAHASQTPPPVKVRETFVICAAKTPAEVKKARESFPNREIIAVPADMAFGTGHHATTATVLRLLVDAAKPLQSAGKEWSMADLGCGSGILAIAASKLGASRVWGCDYDPAAVKISKENATRNDTPKVRFSQIDVLRWEPKQTWDIVAANIFHDVLEAAFPQILRSVAPGGILMLSGILNTQAKDCLAAGKRAGFVVTKVVTRGKWVTAVGTVRRS